MILKVDVRNIQSSVTFIFLPIFVLLLSACGSDVQKPSPQKTNLFAIPATIQSASLPAACTNNLTAWFTVDSGDTVPLSINDGQLSIPLEGISPGGHVFELEFRCLIQGEQIVLLKGTKSHQVTQDKNPVLFNESDFLALVDTDNDSVGNIVELELGYDPTVADLPDAPDLAVNANIKQLNFGWSTSLFTAHYTLLKSTDAGMTFDSVVADNITALEYSEDIAAHKLDWLSTQYQLLACNSVGCMGSDPVGVTDKMLESIAYIKASNSDRQDYFGRSVALSADGNTLVVGAEQEASPAVGVNDTLIGQLDNTATFSGAVYVFTRNNSTWHQQAYVKASNTEVSDRFGSSVALSADGNTMAVGASSEKSAAIGVNDAMLGQGDNSASEAGAVYVFTRDNDAWQQEAYVKASNTEAGDRFGKSVALSADGNTLAVGADGEDSVTTVLNSGPLGQADNGAQHSGAVYVFSRTNSAWQQQSYVKASNAETADQFGWSVALSADGNTLAVGAPFEDGAAIGVDNTFIEEADNNASASGAVYVFTRANITWQQQMYIKAFNTDVNDWFGKSVTLSADGNTLAVGATEEDSAAKGVNDTLIGQADESAVEAGAVYVYTRIESVWQQNAYIKASNTDANDSFGISVALSADGNVLVVGANNEGSSAIGVNDFLIGQIDNNSRDSGAAYVFNRLNNTWQQQAYVKATNTDLADYFGYSIAVSSDGNILAVGAYLEDSAAVGVNDPLIGQSDFNASNSGAVYLY